jgi:hypothetical protein
MEHGFVKSLYKRCRVNSKRIDECQVIAAKKQSGGQLTNEQQQKLNKQIGYQNELSADLETLDLFLEHHVRAATP